MTSTIPPIAIIGAGLSGLTLGLCLKHRGIAAVVYDRATSPTRHNHGVVLHASTYRPLLEILNIDETAFREKLAIILPQGDRGSLSRTNNSLPTDAFRCHRGRLEALLGKDLSISWGKRLKDLQLISQFKELTATFDDGYTLKTKCLIGCDGPHSMTRQIMSSRMKLQVLPYVVFNGNRLISITEYMENMHDYMQNSVHTQVHIGDILLEISVNDISKSHVDLSYTYSRLARENIDPLHKPDRLIVHAIDVPEEFYDELEALQGLEPPFKAIFDAEKVRGDRVLHWLMRTLMPDPGEAKRLAKYDVILIGDAVHATPILGGEGANMAIRDGIDLAHHIVVHGVDAFEAFSNLKFELWKQSVNTSKRTIENMHTFVRPQF